MALSVLIALLIVWIAIAASYQTNYPVGFFVGTVSAASYASDAPGRPGGAGGQREEETARSRGSVELGRLEPPPPGCSADQGTFKYGSLISMFSCAKMFRWL